MMEWKIGCGKNLIAAKENQGATDITYLRVGGPKADKPRPTFKLFLFCLLWVTKRFRVSDEAIVLV